MIRIASLLVAAIALFAPAQAAVDAVTLAQAFRANAADQYKNRQIKGSGLNFHGVISERIADGTSRPSLVITLGSVREGSAPALIKTVDEFIAAERARTTLVVALSGASLPPPTEKTPQTYEFSGIYDGQVRTIARAGGKILTPPDSGPCKGEQPQGGLEVTFYCAPLLVSATATIKP
jgi:hypothetical protein